MYKNKFYLFYVWACLTISSYSSCCIYCYTFIHISSHLYICMHTIVGRFFFSEN